MNAICFFLGMIFGALVAMGATAVAIAVIGKENL
jgi:hypothetical protein